MLKDYITLIRKLPPVLNLAWFAMHLGLVFLIAGLVRGSGLMTLIGIAPIALGVAISWFSRGPMSDQFFTGVMLGVICSLVAMVIIVPICLVAYLVLGLIDGFDPGNLLKFLHFLAVIAAYITITSVASYKGTREEAPTENPQPESP